MFMSISSFAAFSCCVASRLYQEGVYPLSTTDCCRCQSHDLRPTCSGRAKPLGGMKTNTAVDCPSILPAALTLFFPQRKPLAVVLLWNVYISQFSNLAEIPYPPSYQRFLNLLDVFNFGEKLRC